MINTIRWSNVQNPLVWDDAEIVWGSLISPRQCEVYVRGGLMAEVYGDNETHTRRNAEAVIRSLAVLYES